MSVPVAGSRPLGYFAPEGAEDHHFDVIVVGAGLAGSTAALVGAQAGRRVLLLDAGADPTMSSNTAMSGGRMHVAHAELLADAEDIRQKILGRAHGEIQPELVESIATACGPAGRWLLDQGVELGGAPGGVGSILTPERPLTHGEQAWHERGPHLTLRRLQSRASVLGAAILAGTRAEELVFGDGGVIEGVVTEGGDRYFAPNVVLADGGFHGAADLVKRYLCRRPERLFMRGVPRSSGSALRMAQSAGAHLVNMDRLYGHFVHAEAFENEELWPYPVLDTSLTLGGIIVRPDGERFVDESLGGPHAVNYVARLEDPLSSWVVIDQARWDDLTGQDLSGMEPFKIGFERRNARIERALDAATLAAQMGVDPDGLAATIEAYSGAAENGTAGELPVPRTGKIRSLRGPLVALPLAVGLSYTLGGPVTDRDARVVGQHGPIAGLFAAGGAAASVSGGYYGGLATALTMGWRAGQAIAGNDA
jgi:fumarate reductase flavoprotein subunit